MILPLDIVTDVLLRLPAKSLLRLKIVCKLWHDLINDPSFTNLHLQRSLATQSNLHFVFKTPVLHLADFDTFDNPVELNYPTKYHDHGGVGVVGSCNGLLCLQSFDFNLPLFIYNPTTHTYKTLPFLPISPPFSYTRTLFYYGFGYDGVTEDYKCVRIIRNFSDELGSFEGEVMIYSFKGNAWRMVPSFPYDIDYHSRKNVLLHSNIHWVGAHSDNIVAFDLREETFSTLPVPNLDPTDLIRVFVGVLDGCLCLSISYTNDCHVWVMKEYGVGGSWTRLFTIAKRNGYEELERPLCYSMNAKQLFVHVNTYHQLASVDLDTMSITNVKVADLSGCTSLTSAHVCVENLLMLESRIDIIGKEEQQVKKKKNNKFRRWTRKNER